MSGSTLANSGVFAPHGHNRASRQTRSHGAVRHPRASWRCENVGSTVPQAVPEIKLRALNENGQELEEVFELLSNSDSEPDAADSDIEVIATLQPTSRSSSAAPLTDQNSTLLILTVLQDNDSWEWLGGSRKTVKIIFEHGKKAIDCNRIRYRCKGVPACSQLDPALRSVQRFELGPAPRNTVIAAQQETRHRETHKKIGLRFEFLTHIRGTKCLAIDSLGNKCRGGPVLKAKREGSSRGKQYFVGCSGWTPKFRQNHRFHNIPDNIDENLLANALAGRPLSDDRTKDTPPCSGIVHPPHAHIVNGMQVQGTIQAFPCDALRTIFVPADSSIPKVSFGHKDTYRQCIEANGVLGASVTKERAVYEATPQGNTLAAHAPPLHNRRVKQDLLRRKVGKVSQRSRRRGFIETKKGEKIIVTFVPYLLKSLDDPGVTSFDGDATYKGIEGKINEWELSIFAKVVQRAASILRAYIDGASTDFFEALFGELQRVELMVTAKPTQAQSLAAAASSSRLMLAYRYFPVEMLYLAQFLTPRAVLLVVEGLEGLWAQAAKTPIKARAELGITDQPVSASVGSRRIPLYVF
ncbi:hypothetical protein C8R47DRAFT_1252228 [Mycena vitilis]|nr:hypothetical protein C8R47DRAFT_1252228 [Mycena vitilis]